MDNLIKCAAGWLKSDDCLQGTIFDRTKVLLSFFSSYLMDNRLELEGVLGVGYPKMVGMVNRCWRMIERLLNSYLRGNHSYSYRKVYSFIADMPMSLLDKETRFYKGREPMTNALFTKDEMFHIPFDKRSKVGNQRFSVSGVPCLYLGGSSYICWEELNQVNFSSCNFCGYMNKEAINIFDFALPPSVKFISDIKRISLILACSLKADRDALFKEEYILPQSILLALIRRTMYSHQLFGVRYISSHLLDGDANLFNCDFSNSTWVSRYYNYVFPAAASQGQGYNGDLRALFVQTDTIKMEREILLNPERLVQGDSKEPYLDSQFGLMDSILDEKLGVRSMRTERAVLRERSL